MKKIEELERLNNDLANLFSGTRVATLFLDRDFRIMRYTPAIKDLFKLLHSGIGRPLHDIKFKFDDPDLLKQSAAVLQHLNQHEREVLGDDGRWYLRRILPYRTLDDVIDGVVISFTDIGDLPDALNKARESEQQLLLLADAVPALIAQINTDMKFVFANAAHNDWFATSAEALRDQPLKQFFKTERYKFFQEKCAMALEGKRVAFEETLTHASLGKREVHITLVPITCTNGTNPAGFYFIGTDITERKKKENTILNRQAEAAHANRIASMSELAATIAHQINQPLGSISNYAGALKNLLSGTDNAEALDIAKKLTIQTRAASDIIRELREFIGRRTLDQESLCINALIQRVLSLTEGRIARVGAEVHTRFAESLPTFFGSAIQLEQVLVNLIVNALEAMEGREQRQLTIQTHAEDNTILVSIRDTGPGIDAKDLNRIFDTFYTTKNEGMGMGLAICRGIAEEYGGKLWAESGDKNGTTFTLRLPADENNNPKNDESAG